MKKYQNPAIAQAANAGRCGLCGYSRPANSPTWAMTMLPSNTIISRGQRSLTPVTAQPA